ncbi:MAG TPA: hypothetical protein VG370_34795 [Chloroflexota bacterium]|jgi:hypothetical protein|nr:hypothetical protein [Chloroflexota bacterium]
MRLIWANGLAHRSLVVVRGRNELTPGERDALIRSVISSEALAGVVVPRELLERLLDKVLAEPLPGIG